jgi:hypothetical protein
MTVSAQLAQSVLWCAQPLLQAIVAGVMCQRKLHRTFPMFFAYLVAQIAFFIILFPIQRSGAYELFFYSYWATTSVSVVLGFRVIHEIFLDVFRPYHTLRDLGTVLFRWAGFVMLMVAAVVAASVSGPTDDPFANSIIMLQRTMRVVQVGLVLFLLVFSRYLGITWKQKSFGMSLGFGVFAGIEMLLVSWGNVMKHPDSVALVNMAAYDATILIWMGYMLSRSPERLPADNALQTRRWEESLNGIQHPATAHSLIPMFEGMVDRALARTPETVSAMSDVLSKTDGVLARQAAAAAVSSASPFPARPLTPQNATKS